MGEENIIQGMVPLEPIPNCTAGQKIFDALIKHRNLPAAVINVEKNYSISFEDILQKSVRVALSLQKCGYGKDNTLAICSENSCLYYYPLLAGLYLGISVAPLNQDYIKNELLHAANLSKPSIIFCSMRNLEKVLQLKADFPTLERIVVLDLNKEVDGVQSLDKFIAENSEENYDVTKFNPTEFDSRDHVALIMCSSGTTGLPKGVMLTHRNVVVNGLITGDRRFAYTDGNNTTSVCAVPMFHAAGFGVVLYQLIHGYQLILMDKFNPELYLKAIQDYKIDCIFTVPAIIGFLAKSPRIDKYDISSLKLLICSTAPLSRETELLALNRLKSVTGIAQAYGLTETTVIVLMTPLGEYRPGSSGKLVPYVSAKVVDLNTKKPVGPNKEGELHLKGEIIMKGYVGNEAATKETIDEDGWLHTGDVAYYDEDGFFYIVDRIKELIKFKGFQVPPAELESLLLQHPDIREAGVIGIPDEYAGELPAAFVVRQPGATVTEKEIEEYISDKVSDAKRLRGGVHFIDEVPRSHNGKILRRELRQRAVDMLKK